MFLSRGGADSAIRDLVQSGGVWRTRTTPYAGSVLAAASDSTGVFVFFLDKTGTFAVGKRTATGGYTRAVPVRKTVGLVYQSAATMLSTNGVWRSSSRTPQRRVPTRTASAAGW